MHDDKTAGLVADHDVRSKDVFAQLADMDVGAALPISSPLLDLMRIALPPYIEWLPMSFGQGQTGYAIGQGKPDRLCYATFLSVVGYANLPPPIQS